MWIRRVSGAVAASIVAGAATAATLTLHVKPGDDLRRLGTRIEMVRTHHRDNALRVTFAPGRYFLAAPWVISASESGSAQAPVEFTSQVPRGAILSGGRPLPPLRWDRWRTGIWRAKVAGAAFDRLWLNGNPLIRARYPNFDASRVPFGGTAADATSAQRVARWSNPAGAVIHALTSNRWGSMAIPIMGKKSDGTLLLGNAVGINRESIPSDQDRFVENVLEELDAPLEWYFDARNHWLYFMPSNTASPPSDGFVASHLETLVRFNGRAGKPVHDVKLNGFVFRDTRTTLLKTTEPLLRSDWNFYRGGAVVAEYAQRIDIEQNEFEQLGGNGVVVSGYNRAVHIRGNELHDVGASGFAFVGQPAAVRSPLYEYRQSQEVSVIDRAAGPQSDAYPADSAAEDNLIHDIGLVEKESAGIAISMARRITLSHNTIYRTPRAGVNVGDGTWGGHVIADNDVFDTVRETGDNGAFNSWGRDRFWDPDRDEMNRRVAKEPTLTLLDAVEPITIRHNRMRCDHGWDIDLDDGSSNYVIEDNVLLSGGLKLREGFARVVRNNIIINNSFHPHVWFANSGDVFEHNIVSGAYRPILMQHWGKSIDYNAFQTAKALQQARSAGTDAYSVAGSIDFLDPAAGDYRVSADSHALAVGFHNFSMDQFGVVDARLKARQQHVEIPALIVDEHSSAPGAVHAVLGMKLKSVETLGEQSATGLAHLAGVLVLEVAPDSPAARAGLAAGDVILEVPADQTSPADPTPDVQAFMSVLAGRRWQGSMPLKIWHQQAPAAATLSFQ
jgi:PDZ domain